MKNTMTRNMKTKVIAAAMALVAMTSTTTVVMNSAVNTPCITASAADIETGLDITSKMKITLDKDLLTVHKITTKTLLKVIGECWKPYGKFVVPGLEVVLDTIIGGEKDPTMEKLEEISDKVDKLFDKIDESENTIINSIQTEIGLSDFYKSYVNF
uniref:hypothetical protein n=1 Tax=Ruminococcus sp. TaxID=41978 RepID=UPI00258CF7FC